MPQSGTANRVSHVPGSHTGGDSRRRLCLDSREPQAGVFCTGDGHGGSVVRR